MWRMMGALLDVSGSLDVSVIGWERGWMGALLDVGGRVRWRRCCDVDGVVERW